MIKVGWTERRTKSLAFYRNEDTLWETHFQQLSCQNDDRSGTVTDLLVLEIRQFNENLGGRMLNVQFLQNSSAIVCDGDITNLINLELNSTLVGK